MKKLLSLLVMLSIALTISAEKYQVYYDVNTSSSLNFTVQVNYDSVVIGNNMYTLRQLGTITNSGYTFNSYMYSNNERMFCVSTSAITVEVSQGKTVTGYMILIDNHCYLAKKVS